MMKKFVPDTIFVRLFLVLLVILNLSHFLGIAVYQGYDELTEIQEQALHPHQPSLYFWLNLRLIAAAIAAYIAAKWLSRPIKQMADAAQELGENLNRQPLEEQEGPAEVRQASIVFNIMQARIQQQLLERSRFLAAISHDLRTPLTRLKLRVEKMDDASLKLDIRNDIDEMAKMIDETLNFLREDNHVEEWQKLDITALVNSIAEDATEQGHVISVTGSAAPIRAQPLALRRCLNNLIENAFHYGNTASISISEQADRISIVIQDHGKGIPEDQLEAVFSPFYRVEDSRNRHTGGIGLGLSIAREIAQKHHGSLTLQNIKGGGLRATLELPRISKGING